MNDDDNNGVIKHPSWKHAISMMREQGITYGSTFETAQISKWLRIEPEDKKFQFAMISIHQQLEVNDGYYLERIENGKAYKIAEAERHEDVAQTFDYKTKRYALRSVNIRSATLGNPEAQLTDGTRKIMEKNLEHASVRLALISRKTTKMLQSPEKKNEQ